MTDVIAEWESAKLKHRSAPVYAAGDAIARELEACRERIRRVEAVADEMLATATIVQDGTVRGFALRLRSALTAPASSSPTAPDPPEPQK